MGDAIPKETGAYLDEFVARLRAVLAADLVGVYAGGSLALGGYDPRRSEVDVTAVTRDPLSEAAKDGSSPAADALAARRGSGKGLDGARARRFLEAARRSLEQADGGRGAGPTRLTRASSRLYVG